MSQVKLKEPGILRVFLSSPFNGMSEEREELTKHYWPILQSYCNSKGVQFIPVDMRWGITTEQSNDSLTIDICLREIDRSDIFVGFFGQRYGWHGEEDKDLQKSFEVAMANYPWLKQYTDRSVTELEFLHGHLNHPGQIPACICFRDKAHDDLLRDKAAEEGKAREVKMYSSESDHATARMDDLKARVKETEPQCLYVDMAYESPKKGAEKMFSVISEHIKNVMLKPDSNQAVISKRDESLAPHNAFLESRSGLYEGGECYLEQLNAYMETGGAPYLIVGEPGSGKTALLSRWLKEQMTSFPDRVFAYHFVGCTDRSTDPKDIMRRIICELRHHSGRDVEDGSLDALEADQLIAMWRQCVMDLEGQPLTVTVVIDGLDAVIRESKVSKPLYWLIKFPPWVRVVCSTQSEENKEELIRERGWQTLTVQPLDLSTRTKICQEALTLRGKTLSENQLGRIVNAEQTQNPLFLTVVMEELFNFGYFRKLDERIDSLVTSANTQELFRNFLARLEGDYNSKEYGENLVEKVMCALYVSRTGLSETELCDMFHIPTQAWSRLYYAMNKFLINRSGYFGLSYVELKEAIYSRYLGNPEEKEERIRELCDYYAVELSAGLQHDKVVPSHYWTELPWLCYQAGDNERLLDTITKPSVFKTMLRKDQYMLVEVVQHLKLTNAAFVEAFKKGIEMYLVDEYNAAHDILQVPNVGELAVRAIDDIMTFVMVAHNYKAGEAFADWMQWILDNNKLFTEEFRDEWRLSVLHSVACMHVNLMDYEKGLAAHKKRVELIEMRNDPSNASYMHEIAVSSQGAGAALIGLKRLDEAEEYLKRSLAIQGPLAEAADASKDIRERVATTKTSMAEVLKGRGLYQESIDLYEEVIKIGESVNIYSSILDPKSSYALTNMGLCYRRLGEFDKAKEVYTRSLKVKENALGWYHRDVAITCVCFASLAGDQKDYASAEKHIRDAIDIYEHVDMGQAHEGMQAKENLVFYMILQSPAKPEKLVQAEPYFWDVYDFLTREGKLEQGLPVVHREMLRHLFRQARYEEALKLALSYVHTEALLDPMCFAFIHHCDCNNPPEGGAPQRCYEESIERGLDLYADIKLYQCKLGELVSQRNLQAILDLLDRYEEKANDSSDELYRGAEVYCNQYGWQEGLKAIFEHGVQRVPQSAFMHYHLGVMYGNAGEIRKAYDSWSASYDIQPIYALAGRLAVAGKLLEDPAALKHALDELEGRWAGENGVAEEIEKWKRELALLEPAEDET